MRLLRCARSLLSLSFFVAGCVGGFVSLPGLLSIKTCIRNVTWPAVVHVVTAVGGQSEEGYNDRNSVEWVVLSLSSMICNSRQGSSETQ